MSKMRVRVERDRLGHLIITAVSERIRAATTRRLLAAGVLPAELDTTVYVQLEEDREAWKCAMSEAAWSQVEEGYTATTDIDPERWEAHVFGQHGVDPHMLTSQLLTYRTADATVLRGKTPIILAHVCNDQGGWGRGFTGAISKRWPEVEDAYRQWHRQGTYFNHALGYAVRFALGAVQLVAVNEKHWVANMIAQQGYKSAARPEPLNRAALHAALCSVCSWALDNGATVQMPRIGCGLGGAQWSTIAPILSGTLCASGIEVVVCDPPPVTPRTVTRRG